MIRNETDKPLLVRVPGWVPESSIQLVLDGQISDLVLQERFISVSRDTTHLELHYFLPEYATEEEWRDEDATQESVVFTWRGDEICGVDQPGGYLAAFPKECPYLAMREK
jgi:hypothetical protein